MRVALVHYWLVNMRGGERVLETLCDIYPDADIFTLVVDYDHISEKIKKHRIITSFLQKIGGCRHYKKMLPLMPQALESLDLTKYDLIISSESGPAKGIIPRPDALHICYCHSPMRYIWDLFPQYIEESNYLTRIALSLFAPGLRQWDVTTSSRVDYFIANSKYVAARIKKYYRRDATVINPPVELARFSQSSKIEKYYICAGQITQYKKIDLAIEAFNKNGLPLFVIGDGASKKMRKKAHDNIRFLGPVSDTDMAYYFSNCRALIFPGIEDFGIVPLEVMASGRPVIAYAAGGALETVIPNKTGILFYEQSPDALCKAVEQMEKEYDKFSGDEVRRFASSYDRLNFERKIRDYINGKIIIHKTEQLK